MGYILRQQKYNPPWGHLCVGKWCKNGFEVVFTLVPGHVHGWISTVTYVFGVSPRGQDQHGLRVSVTIALWLLLKYKADASRALTLP